MRPFLIIFIASICSYEDKLEFEESFSSVTEATKLDTVRVDEGLVIAVTHLGSSGCSSYSRYTISDNDPIFEIELFQKRPEESVCTTEIIELKTTIQMSFDKTGQKILRYKQNDSYLLDTLEVIN